MDVLLAFLGWFFGGITTILIAIWVERLRSPVLKFSIEEPLTLAPTSAFSNPWRSLRVKVSNERLPSWANWLVRLPAQQCRAEIAFLRLDATPLFEKPTTGRWTGTQEPLVAFLSNDKGETIPVLTNPQMLTPALDVYPDDSELLDIVVRVEGEDLCYCWNDETYFYHDWRNPHRVLGHGLYLVEVTISSSGRKRRGQFRLSNDGPFTAFRLTEITPADRQAIEARDRT